MPPASAGLTSALAYQASPFVALLLVLWVEWCGALWGSCGVLLVRGVWSIWCGTSRYACFSHHIISTTSCNPCQSESRTRIKSLNYYVWVVL